MSQETGTPASGQHGRPAPAGPVLRRLAAGLLRWLRNDLFRSTENVPVSWRKVLLALVSVAAAMAVSLSRTVGPGHSTPSGSRTRSSSSTRLSTTPSGRADRADQLLLPGAGPPHHRDRGPVPADLGAGLMSAAAAAEYAMYGLVAYIASGPYLRSRWLRLLIAAPVCALPLAYTQVNNDLVTVQFLGLFGAFWTLLWRPGTRAGQDPVPAGHGHRVVDRRAQRRLLSAGDRPAGRRPVQERLVRGHRVGQRGVAAAERDRARQEQARPVRREQPVVHREELRGPDGAAGAVRRALARRAGHQLPRRRRAAAHPQRRRPRCPDHRRLAGHRCCVVVLAAARFTDPNWTLAASRRCSALASRSTRC